MKIKMTVEEGSIVVRGDYRVLYNFLVNWDKFCNLAKRSFVSYGLEQSKFDKEYHQLYKVLNNGLTPENN